MLWHITFAIEGSQATRPACSQLLGHLSSSGSGRGRAPFYIISLDLVRQIAPLICGSLKDSTSPGPRGSGIVVSWSPIIDHHLCTSPIRKQEMRGNARHVDSWLGLSYALRAATRWHPQIITTARRADVPVSYRTIHANGKLV